MTKREMENRAKANIRTYNASRESSLFDAYGRFSSAKANAWRYCEELCSRLDGWGLKVLSHNTFVFTAGFLFCDKENGEVKFMYISPNYDVAVDYIG